MREEVISSGTADPIRLARSTSPPPTPAASSAGASSPAIPANVGSIDWLGGGQSSKAGSLSCTGSRPPRTSLSTNACGSTIGSSQPSCRPWEREDLLRRLATFKPSNWFGKPKEASSLACARRGWMNTNNDKIECEICGAQLSFVTPGSWTSSEAETAAEAFAKQLDVDHKVACPWRGNCCADSLVQFPPTPPSALIDGYKDRFDGLLQFLSLPVVSPSAIEKMRMSRGQQIDRFLSQFYSLSAGETSSWKDDMPATDFSNGDDLNIYYQAPKLISLCGWEPRWLPDVQDCEEYSAQSARNVCSVDPSENKLVPTKDSAFSKKALSSTTKRDIGKKKMVILESNSNSNLRCPLLDCTLCGATVKVCNFVTVPRPLRFDANNIEPDSVRKRPLAWGISAASGISGRIHTDGIEKERISSHYEATTEEGKAPTAGVDLNLTMAGGLPSAEFKPTATSEPFDDGGLGRDLVIGQPAGSEVGDRAASYESRGPSPRKRSLEEGGSTVDRPQDRTQQVDNLEGTVIDRDGDEVGDSRQYSDLPSKRARGLDIFSSPHPIHRVDSSGAGPSRPFGFDIDIDVNRADTFREVSDTAIGFNSARDSARASSVIAMDIIDRYAEEDSMESVENYPGEVDDIHFPSPAVHRNIDVNDTPEFNYSNQAQQSTCLPAAASVARDIGNSSTNEGEEIFNAETATANARDRISFGISGGSVGMGASHEAEIHGADVSIHRGDSVVGDAELIAEVTENIGQMGESAPGRGLMDEFAPELGREDPHGDSQDVMSQSVGKADSGSKIYGSTKAESAESGEKIDNNRGQENSAHPSMSCNAVIYSSFDVSKEEVTQAGKASGTDDCMLVESNYVCANGTGLPNEENNNDFNAGEFDPIAHHNHFCPWVNGNVAAAGTASSSSSSSSTMIAAHCGWQLTLDALDAYLSEGGFPNQTAESESAASLYKDKYVSHQRKLLARSSASKNRGRR